MSKGKKIALGILAFVVVVLLVLAVAIPILIDVDRYRPQVAKHLEEVTGKPVAIGKLTIHLLPNVSIRVDDFAVSNPEGFPKGEFVKAKSIVADVDAGALWDHKVIINSLAIEDPVLNILQDTRGRWNFENPPAPRTAKAPAAGSPSSFTLGVISKVTISNAQLKAASLVSSSREGPAYFQGREVTLDLSQVDLNAFSGASAALTSPTRKIYAGAHDAGWIVSLAYAADPKGQPAAQGTLSAKSLGFGNLSVTSVKSKLRLFPKQVFFDDLNFNLYDGHAAGGLAVNLAGRNPSFNTNAKLIGVNVAKLLESFPDSRGKMTGTMDGNFKLAGEMTHSADPLAGMRGNGQVSIKNGKLPSLNLNKNLMALAKLSNLGMAQGDPSSFSSMATDFTIANNQITNNKVSIVGNGIDIDGAGILGLAGARSMDYQGIAKLAAGQSPVSGLLGGLTGATMEDGKLNLPFSIAGTLANPRFILKSLGSQNQANALQNLLGKKDSTQSGDQQQPADLVQGITGLFKKKKPPQ
jgi:uncharacterized protein involved in outer membrane biogenesis